MASASMDAVIRAEHRSPTDLRSPGPKPFAPGAGAPTVREEPGFGVGGPRFRCRSTALGAKGSQARAPSHPARVLLRFEKNPGLDVGAPPSVRKGVKPEHLRTRGGCSYGSRRTPVLMQENPGLGVGAPPSVRKGCQARAPSHPGRVLLPFERDPRF